MVTIDIPTSTQTEFVEITAAVRQAVSESNVTNGICVVYCPHTTAAITINENADPDVVRDMLHAVNKLVPHADFEYRHAEGNSAAHIKASTFGASDQIPIVNGNLVLGTWQGIYFCEFDGPRSRKTHIQILSA